MAELLQIAGYSAVGLTLPTGLMKERLPPLRKLFERAGLETYLRVDLSATSRVELLRLLRRFRNAYDIVAVKCLNQVVAQVACRDRRVDLVFFDPRNSRVKFGHPLARLLRCSIEFSLISVLQGETSSEIFSRITKEASVAREHRNEVVLSSGCSSSAMVRSPLQISAIAASIGLSNEQSTHGVSKTPLSIITRNQERRSREYVEEGVKLVLAKRSE